MREIIKTSMTIAELWETGRYKELKCKVSSKSSLQTSMNNFMLIKPEVATKFFNKEGKSPIIIDVDSFIEAFNDSYGKRNGNTKRHKPKAFLSDVEGWTATAIDCYERKSNCIGCFYNEYPTLKGGCQMKTIVQTYYEQFGDPFKKVRELV